MKKLNICLEGDALVNSLERISSTENIKISDLVANVLMDFVEENYCTVKEEFAQKILQDERNHNELTFDTPEELFGFLGLNR